MAYFEPRSAHAQHSAREHRGRLDDDVSAFGIATDRWSGEPLMQILRWLMHFLKKKSSILSPHYNVIQLDIAGRPSVSFFQDLREDR
jgi:hypothetical protein